MKIDILLYELLINWMDLDKRLNKNEISKAEYLEEIGQLITKTRESIIEVTSVPAEL